MAISFAFERDLKTALAGVAAKHNVQLDDELFDFVTSTVVRQITSKTEAVDDFKLHCHLYGLKPEHLGATFRSGSATYKITGLVPSRPKYPISAINVRTGRGYKFSERQIPFAEKRGSLPLIPESLTDITFGQCSNADKFDFGKGKSVGQCTAAATTKRKEGFGRRGQMKPYCAECARLIDDARAEMEAEARCS